MSAWQLGLRKSLPAMRSSTTPPGTQGVGVPVGQQPADPCPQRELVSGQQLRGQNDVAVAGNAVVELDDDARDGRTDGPEPDHRRDHVGEVVHVLARRGAAGRQRRASAVVRCSWWPGSGAWAVCRTPGSRARAPGRARARRRSTPRSALAPRSRHRSRTRASSSGRPRSLAASGRAPGSWAGTRWTLRRAASRSSTGISARYPSRTAGGTGRLEQVDDVHLRAGGEQHAVQEPVLERRDPVAVVLEDAAVERERRQGDDRVLLAAAAPVRGPRLSQQRALQLLRTRHQGPAGRPHGHGAPPRGAAGKAEGRPRERERPSGQCLG